MAFKAAIFDVGGVLKENPDAYLKQYSEKNGLPSMFMREVFHKGSPNNAFSKMESGEYTFSQGIGELQRDFEKAAKEKNVKLPKSFNIEKIMMDLLKLPIYKEMINAIIGLKNNGLKVGVLTNTFVYDLPLLDDEDPVRRTVSMKLIFDQIIKSCHVGMRKPDPEIYKLACREMGVEPKEVIFVDDLESNVNGAKAVGMTTILFTDVKSTLTRLQELTDVNVFEKAKPISVDPEKIAHGYATSEDGVKLHYVEMGEGPAVILCHGFPESWYSWRKQIPALVLAGYRVIVPDQRGFGLSSAPMEIKDYTHDHLCKDIKDIMDSLNIPRATVVGHDWGGVVVWLMALRYPSRVRAVVGVNTPYFPPDPRVNRWDRIREDPGVLDYQLYFQEPGVAEAELEKDLEKTFKYFFRTSSKQDYYPGMEKCTVANVRQRGGLLVGVPDNLPLPSLLTEKDLAYYVKQYKTSGFRGPLNWYRNHDQNWKNSVKDVGRKIYAPSLMVTAGKDRVLPPELSKPMEEWVPNLSRVNIEDCGHWTQMERPNELNEGLIKWLNDVHKKANIPVLPRF
ncbi:bifunctional epoxide hydrolase 2-like [Acanthaster planci]|uniref:Bifunctional epoxide hydrolase 2-like n=1 Tax=Acanthaster planci TaxID=133434 RepID=A0A8B7ZIK8_ACAPL|nr:bifunctional epoxide hydrolase 2-like [Acanthaster planci]